MTLETIVHKTLAGKLQGSLTYVLSDATQDRYGDVIEPAGWDLKWFKKNPIALFNHNAHAPIGRWTNVRIDGGRLLADLDLAAEGTSPRIDEIRNLIDQDILRATSVGFRPLKEVPLDPEKPWLGTHYTKQELLETSIVSVPANPAALQVARSMNISNETLSLAFGKQAVIEHRAVTTIGKQAAFQSPKARKPNMTDLVSKRVIETQEKLNVAQAALDEYFVEDDADPDQMEVLTSEVEHLKTKLASFQRAEQALATNLAQELSGQKPQVPAIIPRKPLGVQLPEPSKSDLVIRAAVCFVVGKVLGKDPLTILEERYRDHEPTNIVVRAAVAPGTTTTAGWAAELVEEATVDFLETLRPIAVFPQLASLGSQLTFGPGRGSLRIPSRATTPSISGSFVGEGSPIPVRRLGLTSIPLLPHKMGVISAFTRELARYSTPQIEGLLRTEIMADTAITLDTLLLDAVAGSAIRPAGLTNGVAGLTATAGGGYKAILGDIATLAAPFDAANAGRNLALIMNTAQARLLTMAPGPDGTFGWANQFLTEFTIIASTTVPAGHVYMVDATDFVSVSGAPEFEVSEQAVLHMEDTTPLQIGSTGTPTVVAAPTQSMFQTASMALRMLLDVTWAMRRTGMVQHIVAVNWVPA